MKTSGICPCINLLKYKKKETNGMFKEIVDEFPPSHNIIFL